VGARRGGIVHSLSGYRDPSVNAGSRHKRRSIAAWTAIWLAWNTLTPARPAVRPRARVRGVALREQSDPASPHTADHGGL